MEWVEGVALYEWARRRGRPLTSRQALQLLAQVARALEALHRVGLHRDVKGDNVLVTGGGRAVLVDLGAGWLPGSSTLTEGALPPGTPQYRSPEALRFREAFRVDPEAHYEARPADDVYALGVTAYRLTTGIYPPEPGGSGRLLRPSELATVAPPLEALILRMLSEDREARGTATELAQELEAAAASAGREADTAIRPHVSVLPTTQTRLRGHWAWRARALARTAAPLAAVAAMAGGLLVLAGAALRDGRAAPLPTIAEERHMPPIEAPDAGVAEEALLSVAQVPQPTAPSHAVALPMLKAPMPGQRKPPCDPDYELAALGACWVILRKEPPCGAGGYEYDGKCVRASFNAPRQPASDPP
jgi:hypothetical protein